MSRATPWLLHLALLSLAAAQAPAPGNTENIASSIFGTATAAPTTATSTPTATATGTTSTTPTPTQTGDSTPELQRDGLVRVYFIFIALVVVVAVMGSFLYYRRRRKMLAMAQDTNNRQSALAQDLRDWDPARGRRRYWQGRWRSDNSTVEEGLNEHGEAPPPYIPKTNEPAIPLHTLSREDAGLKPPDYDEGANTAGGGGSSTGPGQTPRP